MIYLKVLREKKVIEIKQPKIATQNRKKEKKCLKNSILFQKIAAVSAEENSK